MGRYAQAKRRGSSLPGELSAPSAPLLSWSEPDLLFVWDGSDPAQWAFQTSVDGETEWEPEDTVLGDLRNFTPVSLGFYYRVRGIDGDSNPLTAWSNVVFVPA